MLASVLISLHLLAIITPALRNATDYGEPSYLVLRLDEIFRPYTQAFHLHHAYFFFAPDPGPSFSLQYDVYAPQGTLAESAKIPDRSRHFPRLLYHRHFMLSEQWANLYDGDEPLPDDASDEIRQLAQRRSNMFQRRGEGFRDHLRHAYGNDDVRMTLIEHRQPSLVEFFAGAKLDDPRMYRRIPVLVAPLQGVESPKAPREVEELESLDAPKTGEPAERAGASRSGQRSAP